MTLMRISTVAFFTALVLTMAWPDGASEAVDVTACGDFRAIRATSLDIFGRFSGSASIKCSQPTVADVYAGFAFFDPVCAGFRLILPTVTGFHEPIVTGFETPCLTSFRGNQRATPLLDNILILPSETPQSIPLFEFAVPQNFPPTSFFVVALTTPNATRDEILRSFTGELVPSVTKLAIADCVFNRNFQLICTPR